LKKVFAPLCIREFPALIEKVKMIENLKKDDNKVMRSYGGGSASWRTRAQLQKPYDRPSQPKVGPTPQQQQQQFKLQQQQFRPQQQ